MDFYRIILTFLLSVSAPTCFASSTSSAQQQSSSDEKKNSHAIEHLYAAQHQRKNGLRLLILDTDGKRQYNYRNLITMAENTGFITSYKSLYDFLENPVVATADYDALFLVIGVSFLKNIHSEQVKKVLLVSEQITETLYLAVRNLYYVGLCDARSLDPSPAVRRFCVNGKKQNDVARSRAPRPARAYRADGPG